VRRQSRAQKAVEVQLSSSLDDDDDDVYYARRN
jgi:hypothetical protein